MKILPVLFISMLLLFPVNTSAHMIGQPPYFKVDGIFTDYYPVPSSSLPDFDLPQDTTKKSYLVGEKIDFEIDETALPVPKEIVESTTFDWDFGDGEKAKGLKNSHTYKKMGTYFMKIFASSPDSPEPQLLQTTALNIIPDANYQLPQSIIKVDGKSSKDPLVDIIEADFSKEISFDGSSSTPPSEITEYLWDFGDTLSDKNKIVKHKYGENPYIAFAVLRIKTKDGFISDSYVQISEKKSNSILGNSTPTGSSSASGFDWKVLLGAGVLSLILTSLIFFIYRKITTSKRKS